MHKRIVGALTALIMFLSVGANTITAADEEIIPIHELHIDGITVPEAGETAGGIAPLYVPEDAPYSIFAFSWYDCDTGDFLSDNEEFISGHTYREGASLEPDDGYCFAGDITVLIDGTVDPELTVECEPYVCTVWSRQMLCGEQIEPIPVSEICVYGFTIPIEGACAGECTALYTFEDAHYSIVSAGWIDCTANELMSADSVFLAGGSYSEYAVVAPEEGCFFAQDCAFLVNGDPLLADASGCMLLTGDPETEGCALITALQIRLPEAYLAGDADMNGSVDTLDALLVLRCVLQLDGDEEDLIARCDMDGNGVLDTVDALLIMRTTLGL